MALPKEWEAYRDGVVHPSVRMSCYPWVVRSVT